jgi:hypothetical protein
MGSETRSKVATAAISLKKPDTHQQGKKLKQHKNNEQSSPGTDKRAN